MTLLLPELERQLRAVVRTELEGPRRRRPAAGVFVVALGAAVAVAVAVFAVAVLSAGRRGSVPVASAGAARYASPCVGTPPSAAGAYAAVASGSLDGHHWTLLARRGAPGYQGVLRGRVVIDGRSYAFCPRELQLTMVALRPRAFVYGYVAVRNVATIRFLLSSRAAVGVGRIAGPQRSVPVAGGTFFVGVLPGSPCAQGSILVAAGVRASQSAQLQGLSGADTDELLGACHPGQVVPVRPPPPAPTLPGAPAGLSPAARAEVLHGRQVAGQAGCEACHQIGAAGNNGPGPNLTDVGKRLPPAAIRAALLNPAPPMPSFRALRGAALRALVAYLSELRGRR